ncbi:MAG: Ig-like domain-containing protein [Thermoplasmata archaeon]
MVEFTFVAPFLGDLAGNAMAADYVWSWTTGSAPDTTAPTVISTVPANAATDVAIDSAITATFSEAMDPLTITTITFTLKQGTTPVSGTVTYSQVSAVFTPSSNLAANTEYTATITTGATDLAGNTLATNYVWSFDTNPAVIPPANGTIVGRIVDENGDPIQNATVSLGDTGLTATTNSNGEYTFTDVPPGTYTLGFNASGYEPTTTSVTVTAGEPTTVPDTVLVPSDDGSSNWWWILLVVAAVAVAALVGLSLMTKKPNAGAKAGEGREPETPEETFPNEPLGEAPEKPPLE